MKYKCIYPVRKNLKLYKEKISLPEVNLKYKI